MKYHDDVLISPIQCGCVAFSQCVHRISIQMIIFSLSVSVCLEEEEEEKHQ